MKYSATILLLAAAVFWASASAKPPNARQLLINGFTRGLIKGLKENVHEPHRTVLINKVHEIRQQHSDSYEDYMNDILTVLAKHFRYVDSDEELHSTDKISSEILYGVYARTLVSMAPPADREALMKKYPKALGKDYENEADVKAELVKLFEEETGMSFKDIEAELEADEKKLAEFEEKLAEELINTLASAISEKTGSSEED